MITTERFILKPLTHPQVIKYRNLNNELEDELGLNDGRRTITKSLEENLIKYTLKWIEDDPENYLFATIWIIIDKTENIIVGKLSFKGKPNDKGEIEIGYSTEPHQRNKGYMGEAIKEMLSWAFGHDEVKSILAETLPENTASIKSLAKNGFKEYKRAGSMVWWKIEKPGNSLKQN